MSPKQSQGQKLLMMITYKCSGILSGFYHNIFNACNIVENKCLKAMSGDLNLGSLIYIN